MAASSQEKDFVHIVARRVAEATGRAPDVRAVNIAEFERNGDTYDVERKLKDQLAFKADTIIIAIGENVPTLDSEDAKAKFKTSLVTLLRRFKSESGATIIVRSCFWPNANKDLVLRQACEEVGGVFVDISHISKNESAYARSERKFTHEGVGLHPGDRGMQAIADAITDAMEKQRLPRLK
jgi:hypothetical protein